MNIAIITGGETGEREVSIRSAGNLAKNLDFATYEIYIFPEDQDKFLRDYKDFELAIPVIHGLGGEDGSIQGFLKTLQLPYIFSEIAAHAIGIDKLLGKKVSRSVGIKTPSDFFEPNLQYPLFAKPRFGGSSIASRLCQNEKELLDLKAINHNTEFIYESPLVGREFTVGVVDSNNETVALPVIEIVSKSGFFDFESKYDPAKLAQEICPAQISNELSDELKKQALLIHTTIGAKHLSRTDFIVSQDGAVFFLEINTIPGLTDTSLVPKMLREANLQFSILLKHWCERALKPSGRGN